MNKYDGENVCLFPSIPIPKIVLIFNLAQVLSVDYTCIVDCMMNLELLLLEVRLQDVYASQKKYQLCSKREGFLDHLTFSMGQDYPSCSTFAEKR